MASTLATRFEAAAARHPQRVAVGHPQHGTLTYEALEHLSSRVRDRLNHMGVRPGDRVGLHLPKSVDSIAAIFGVLRTGAAYVPVDADAPVERGAYILADCSVAAVLTERRVERELVAALGERGLSPGVLTLEDPADGSALREALDDADARGVAPATATYDGGPDDLAYVLYTSGSTGQPKGVRLSHRAALTFIEWCEGEFGPRPDDVYSSHAPLHFDLSIHDVFVPLFNGARLVVIDEGTGKDPLGLAETIASERISVWYSTPSILNLLASYGKLDRHDFGALRLVLFAGEVFPIPQLRALKALWPEPRYYNLYGPTETNVCTWFEVPATIPDERVAPFPIGRICPPLRGRVVDESGEAAPAGKQGELVVHGPGVMDGYWNLPEQNERAFMVDEAGARWYRTGDLVAEIEPGVYTFHGRRDRMVKRRGYRVELGEIEAGLATHPGLEEVAVVAVPGPDHGVRIKAFLVVPGDERPSVIQLKKHSVAHLPRYMVPDTFEFLEALPRTSTDKIDYQALLARG